MTVSEAINVVTVEETFDENYPINQMNLSYNLRQSPHTFLL